MSCMYRLLWTSKATLESHSHLPLWMLCKMPMLIKLWQSDCENPTRFWKRASPEVFIEEGFLCVFGSPLPLHGDPSVTFVAYFCVLVLPIALQSHKHSDFLNLSPFDFKILLNMTQSSFSLEMPLSGRVFQMNSFQSCLILDSLGCIFICDMECV